MTLFFYARSGIEEKTGLESIVDSQVFWYSVANLAFGEEEVSLVRSAVNWSSPGTVSAADLILTDSSSFMHTAGTVSCSETLGLFESRYVLHGGSLHCRDLELRDDGAEFYQSAGDLIVNGRLTIGAADGSPVMHLTDGRIQTNSLDISDNSSLNFTGGKGVLLVEGLALQGAIDLIGSGRITYRGQAVAAGFFIIDQGEDFTTVRLRHPDYDTVYVGSSAGGDLLWPDHWSHGVPSKFNRGIVPPGIGKIFQEQAFGRPQGFIPYVDLESLSIHFSDGLDLGVSTTYVDSEFTFDGTGDVRLWGYSVGIPPGNEFTWNSSGKMSVESGLGMSGGVIRQHRGHIEIGDDEVTDFGNNNALVIGGTFYLYGGVFSGNELAFGVGRHATFNGEDEAVFHQFGGKVSMEETVLGDGGPGVWNLTDGVFEIERVFKIGEQGTLNFTGGPGALVFQQRDEFETISTRLKGFISTGRITVRGMSAVESDFLLELTPTHGRMVLQEEAQDTVFTGAIDNDLDKSENWTRGVPHNGEGADELRGIVPEGFPNLEGTVREMSIAFLGDSGLARQRNGTLVATEVSFEGHGNAMPSPSRWILGGDTEWTWNSLGSLSLVEASLSSGAALNVSRGRVNANNWEITGEGTRVRQSGGTVTVHGQLSVTFGAKYQLDDGMLSANTLRIDGGIVDFTANSTGILRVSHFSSFDDSLESLLSAGSIRVGGEVVNAAEFYIQFTNDGGVEILELRLAGARRSERPFGVSEISLGEDRKSRTVAWPSTRGEAFFVEYSRDLRNWDVLRYRLPAATDAKETRIDANVWGLNYVRVQVLP